MTKTRLAAGLFLFASVTSALAQGVNGPPKPCDLRVQVDLKNSSSIVGIVTSGALVERLGRSGYEPIEDQQERGAGIRIFYYRNQDGFLFLPYRDIREVQVLGTLTPEESRTLRDAVAHAELVTRNKDELARRSKAAAEARKADAASEADGRALLARFPPEKGYSKQLYGDLRRREIVNREKLGAEEQAFVASFEAWEKAYAASELKGSPTSSPKREAKTDDAAAAGDAVTKPPEPKARRGAPPKPPRKAAPKPPPARTTRTTPLPAEGEAPPLPIPDVTGGG